MNKKNKTSQSDDEEDLEALRLAALQTLKKSASEQVSPENIDKNSGTIRNFQYKAGSRPHGNFVNKRGRFYGGRGAKNGQFHSGRPVSSNLISLTPSLPKENTKILEEKPTLILPQDKYVDKSLEESKTDETSSKFDRYKDKSDKEDSEDELLKSDTDNDDDDDDNSQATLKRSNSLEALMQELTDEIQGKSDKEEKVIILKKTKRKKNELEEAAPEKNLNNSLEEKAEENLKKTEDEKVEESGPPKTDTISDAIESNKITPPEEPLLKKRRHSPPPKRNFQGYRGRGRGNFNPSPPFVPVNNPPLPFLPTFPNDVYAASYVAPFRPLSPLHISAETLQTQTMAPLSPRSAAFVLENRAIIEKRKRRSFSRSPSFSPRRSLTPPRRRSLSPRKRSLSPRRRSMSPRKKSRSPKRRSPSPKRRPFSPKRRAFSPKRSPKRRSLSPRRRENPTKNKPNIRERLGFKSSAKPEDVKDKTPEISSSSSSNTSVQKDEKPLDPVLEARKKKFETNEIKIREGVIRLKPKEEVKEEKSEEQSSETTKQEVFLEEPPLEEDELDLNAELDIFSDEEEEEESASETEGRFKAKQQDNEKPTILSFSKLVNGTKQSSIKTLPPKLDHTMSKKKLGVKMERHPKKFERKIEIKIKNPAKYEVGDKVKKESKKSVRKVELGTVNLSKSYQEDDEDDETEIVVENEEDEVENTINNEGDLRAQLSKKRAEKLQKTSSSQETVTPRLLQNALKNALPMKKAKKLKKPQKLSNSELASIKSLFTADIIASQLQLTVRTERRVSVYKKFKFGFKNCTPTDVKLPIHLRLGLACGPSDGIFATSKPKKKSKKRKTIEIDTEDQGSERRRMKAESSVCENFKNYFMTH